MSVCCVCVRVQAKMKVANCVAVCSLTLAADVACSTENTSIRLKISPSLSNCHNNTQLRDGRARQGEGLTTTAPLSICTCTTHGTTLAWVAGVCVCLFTCSHTCAPFSTAQLQIKGNARLFTRTLFILFMSKTHHARSQTCHTVLLSCTDRT